MRTMRSIALELKDVKRAYRQRVWEDADVQKVYRELSDMVQKARADGMTRAEIAAEIGTKDPATLRSLLHGTMMEAPKDKDKDKVEDKVEDTGITFDDLIVQRTPLRKEIQENGNIEEIRVDIKNAPLSAWSDGNPFKPSDAKPVTTWAVWWLGKDGTLRLKEAERTPSPLHGELKAGNPAILGLANH